MSSVWHGCIYEEKLSHQIAPSIADLFYEPSDYDELCFYCVEGACCPHHEIPQPRVRIQHKKGTNPTKSVDYVLDEIFGLQSDCCTKYANYQIKIIENCQENVAVKVQQNFTEKRSVCIDQNITRRKQTDTKLITPERHKDRYPTDVLKNSADVASEIMCKDVEEVFIISRRHRTLSPARSDRQKYQRFRNKQYLCDICDSAFTLKHNIQTHLLLYHPNNEVYTKRIRGKRYRCLKCNSLFRTYAAVQKHQRRQHEVRIRPKCEICQREFPTASLLREHVAVIHLNLRPFKCTKCSAVFGRQGCLRRHDMMCHLNYVYVCPYKQCTHAGFKCSKALAAHIRSIHTHVRPYKCEQCEKRFVRRNDLRIHSDIHNTECKYVCPTCKQMFQRRIHFQKHAKKCQSREVAS
ncbi:Zinc finger C2H2 type family protein [Brugia pahangi]